MTTIAATLNKMAADSRVVAHHSAFPSHKILRVQRSVIGAAGEAAHCAAFIEWMEGKRRKPRFSKNSGFSGLVLNRKGLFYVEYDLALNKVHDGMFAIGSGAAFAIGSMHRDLLLGNEPDPIAAIQVACERDPGSGGPVSWLSLSRG